MVFPWSPRLSTPGHRVIAQSVWNPLQFLCPWDMSLLLSLQQDIPYDITCIVHLLSSLIVHLGCLLKETLGTCRQTSLSWSRGGPSLLLSNLTHGQSQGSSPPASPFSSISTSSSSEQEMQSQRPSCPSNQFPLSLLRLSCENTSTYSASYVISFSHFKLQYALLKNKLTKTSPKAKWHKQLHFLEPSVLMKFQNVVSDH